MQAARNGDRAGVSRCSEGDHEGHTREVVQEERSPSMSYITQYVCIGEFQPYYEHCWKTNIQDIHYLMYVHVPSHTNNATSFHVQIVLYNNSCLFSQVKNKP